MTRIKYLALFTCFSLSLLSVSSHSAETQWNNSGSLCRGEESADNDCIDYSFGRLKNMCDDRDISVICPFGQLEDLAATNPSDIEDVKLWYVDNNSSVNFYCLLISRDDKATNILQMNMDSERDGHSKSSTVWTFDWPKMDHYSDPGTSYIYCDVPRKQDGDYSCIYGIRVIQD